METRELCQYIGVTVEEKILQISPTWVREHQCDIYWIKFFVLADEEEDDETDASQLLDKLEKKGFTKKTSKEIYNWLTGMNKDKFEHQSLNYWLERYIDDRYSTWEEENES